MGYGTNLIAPAMPVAMQRNKVLIGPGGLVARSLGPKRNGIVGFGLYVTAPTMTFPGIAELLVSYQPVATEQGVGPLGHDPAPCGHACPRVPAAGVTASSRSMARRSRSSFTTASSAPSSARSRLNAAGEWANSRMPFVQY